MNKKQAQIITGTLTQTSKLPCKSYSLPTANCKTGFKLAQIDGTICNSCYANKGFYNVYKNTIQKSQNYRLDALTHPDWVVSMAILIGTDNYFRWHDSGDIQDMAHLLKIVEIAELLPNCKFWLPTRERALIKNYLKTFGTFPDNLIVRLSAVYFDQVAVTFDGLNTSTSHKLKLAIGFQCTAPKNKGECGLCRACWDKKVPNVSYKAH